MATGQYYDMWDGLKDWLAQEDVMIARRGKGTAEDIERQTVLRGVLRHMWESERIYPTTDAAPQTPGSKGNS